MRATRPKAVPRPFIDNIQVLFLPIRSLQALPSVADDSQCCGKSTSTTFKNFRLFLAFTYNGFETPPPQIPVEYDVLGQRSSKFEPSLVGSSCNPVENNSLGWNNL